LTVTGTPTISYTSSESGTATITNASTTAFNYTFGSSFVGNISLLTGTGSTLFINNFTVSNPSYLGTITYPPINISGSVSIPGGTLTGAGNLWTFSGATSGKTINIVPALNSDVTFNGAGSSWTLGSNLICGASTTSSTRTITFTAGSLTLGSFNLYCSIFSNSGSGTRSISTTDGSIYVLATATSTVYSGATLTNFSITGNLKVIVAAVVTGLGTTRTITSGSSAGGSISNAISVEFLGSSSNSLDLSGVFNDINLTNFSGTHVNSPHTVFGDYNAPSNINFTSGAQITTFAPPTGTTKTITVTNAMNKPVTFSGLGTSQITTDLNLGTTRAMVISSGTVDFSSGTVTCSTISTSSGSLLTGAAIINASGSGSVITLNGLVSNTIAIYSVYSATATRTITINSPSSLDSSYGPYLFVTSGSGAVTLTGSSGTFLVKSFGSSGFTGPLVISRDIYFNTEFYIDSGTGSVTGSATIYCKKLVSTGSQASIQFRLKTLPVSLVLDNPDGLRYSGSFDTSGITGSLTILNGTFDAQAAQSNRLTFSGGIISSGSNTRGLTGGSGGSSPSLTTPSLTVSGSGVFSFSYPGVSIATISITGSVAATLDFLYEIVGGTTTSTTVTINTSGTINWGNQLTITGSSSSFLNCGAGSTLPSKINIASTGTTFTLTNQVTLNTVEAQWTNTFTNWNLNGSGTITSLVFNFGVSTQTAKLILGANHTFTNCTIPDRNEARRVFIQSDTNGTRRTITATNPISGNFIDFKDIALTPTNNITGTSLGDVGNNTGITFPAAKTVYWARGSETANNSSAWSLSSNGASPSLSNFPLAQDTMVIPSTSENANVASGTTITFSNEINLGTILSRTRDLSAVLQFSKNCNIVGNLDLNNTSFGPGTSVFTFLNSTSINSTTGFDLNFLGNSLVFNNAANSTSCTITANGITTTSGYTYTFKGLSNGVNGGNPFNLNGNITVINNFILSEVVTTIVSASSSLIVNGYINTVGNFTVNNNCTFSVGLNLTVGQNLVIGSGCSVTIGSFISVSSSFTLASSLTVNATLTVGGAFTLSAGTFTTNTSDVFMAIFLTPFGASPTINMGSCNWYVTNNWILVSSAILNSGTSTILLGPYFGDTIIFSGGGKTYNHVIVDNQDFYIDGSNTFNILRKSDCTLRTNLTLLGETTTYVYNMIFDNTIITSQDNNESGINSTIANLSNSALFFTNCTFGGFPGISGVGTIKAPTNRGNANNRAFNIDFSPYTAKTTQIISFFS
jgi:hypothetical protein